MSLSELILVAAFLYGGTYSQTTAAEFDIPQDSVIGPSFDADNDLGCIETKMPHKDAFGYHAITYDTALLAVQNNLSVPVIVSGQSDECYKCALLNISQVKPMTEKLIYLDTSWPLRLTIYHHRHNEPNNVYCTEHVHFGERGTYSLVLVSTNSSSKTDLDVDCLLTTNKEPNDIYIPIYVVLALYTGLAIFYIIYKKGYVAYRTGWFNNVLCCVTTDHIDSELNSSLTLPLTDDKNSINKSPSEKPGRLQFLDTFRGMCVTFMMFGNYGGGSYWFFQHRKWNGLTIADMVFPWFIYIMGVTVVIAFQASFRRKMSRCSMLYKIIRRTITLFVLGCLIDGGNDIPHYRVTGVLQRFSVSYLVVACLQLMSLHDLQTRLSRTMHKYYASFCDIFDYWYEWLLMGALMAVFSCLTHLLPVPGCPTGYLGPGGPLLEDVGGINVTNCTGGAASYIDRWIIGPNHIHQHATPSLIYRTQQVHDSEGILGSITSILLTFFGLQAGKILMIYPTHSQRIKRLVIWGFLLGGLGTLLCKASKEGGWIPINKNLWSVSYVLVAAGCGYILLVICYFTTDVMKWWTGVPFYFPGKNAIFLYVAHEVFKKYNIPFSWQPMYNTHAELLCMAIIGPTLWVVISYRLYTMNIFIKV